MFDLKEFSDGISLLGSVVSTIKSAIDILPKPKKEEASRILLEAVEKLQVSEVQIAKGLGYELCKCTWPPQIMLHVGEVEYGEIFRCPVCCRLVSPDEISPLNDKWRTT